MVLGEWLCSNMESLHIFKLNQLRLHLSKVIAFNTLANTCELLQIV